MLITELPALGKRIRSGKTGGKKMFDFTEKTL